MWVGRSLERFEDEALLRGEGRFIDDLEPIPHAWHAAIVRSQLAHANITVDPTAALAVDGVLGVLTGDGRRPAVEAVPGGDRLAGSPLRGGSGHRRAMWASRSPSSSRATGTSPRTRRSSWPSTTSRSSPSSIRSRASAIHDRSFHYGDVDDALARADLVVRETFRVPRFTCMPVECFGVVCDWDEGAGRLTAWANFQGPFTLHGVAAAALGLRGDRFRLLTPPDSGGSFGVKAAVLPYVVLVGLASRALGVPVRWTRGPARAPRGELGGDRARDHGRGGLHAERRAGRPPIRRDRGCRRVRPRARAGHALPDARLALGRLRRAERGGPVPRRAHEHRSRPASIGGSGGRSSTSGWSG